MSADSKAYRQRVLRIESLEPRQLLASDTGFTLQVDDLVSSPTPSWINLYGEAIDLPANNGFLSSTDPAIAIDFDVTTNSGSPAAEQVGNLVDSNANTKYLNFGETACGFIATLATPAAVKSFRITTANDNAGRDPSSYVIYGTNDPIVSTDHSNGRAESWTEIAAGTLSLPDSRNTTSSAVAFSNSAVFESYKVVFPTVKNGLVYNEMQLADMRFYTASNGIGLNVLDSPTAILAIQDIDGTSTSASPGGSSVANAVDGNPTTAYANFGGVNAGLIVTPAAGASVVSSFSITTSSESSSSDPASWILYGTNESIASLNDSAGTAEAWSYVDSGDLELPLTRQTQSDNMAVENTAAYTSYRLVFPTLRQSTSTTMQLGDVQLYGAQSSAQSAASLRLEAGATGEVLLEIAGDGVAGNVVTDYPSLAEFADLRVVIEAGAGDLTLEETELTIYNADGFRHVVFLPAIDLVAGERLDLWASATGATYYGTPLQLSPDFSTLARQSFYLPGDFNLDGSVDPDDLFVWKATLGSTQQLNADGNWDGVVNIADYTVWRNHLGTTDERQLPPGPFSITGPGDTTSDNTPLVTWEPAANALSYTVEVAADSQFTEVIESSSTTDLSYAVGTILTNGEYYIRVTAFGQFGTESTAENNGLSFVVSSLDIHPNDGFETGFTGWVASSGSATVSFATPTSESALPKTTPYFGSHFASVNVDTDSATAPATLTTTFYADSSETYLLRWFAQSDVNRAGMTVTISSDGPEYQPASFNPSSNGWEGYNFAFKASGMTTVTITFEDAAVYGLDELQIYDTHSGPDHTGTRMDPERHYLWRWGQTAGAADQLMNTDNNISVPLPDGRVVWLYNDTYTGHFDPYDNSGGTDGFVRNYVIIQDGDTLTPWTPGQTSIVPPSGSNFYWPNDAFVEGDKLKVVLHEVSGLTFMGSVVATLSLPDLTLDGITSHTTWNMSKVLDGGDGYFYVYGGTSGSGDHGVARVAKGSFNNFASWRYWAGSSWSSNINAAVELTHLDGLWSMARLGPNNYVAISSGFVGSSWRASFASSPTGPWTTPENNIIGYPPIDFEALTAYYYMPYLHRDTVQNGVYSVGFSDIGPSGADGDGMYLSNRPGADQNFYNIQYFLTPNLLELSPYTTHSYSDAFTDNDPAEWKTYDGTWEAEGGTWSAVTAPGASAKAVALGVVNDQTVVEVDVTATGGDAGLLFRGSEYATGNDNYDGYYAGIKPGTGVVLGRMDSGVWNALATLPMTIANGVSYHLRVVADGSAIEVYVDDMTTPKIALSDSTYSQGSTGLRAFSSSATWDNFNVSETVVNSLESVYASAQEPEIALAAMQGVADSTAGDTTTKEGESKALNSSTNGLSGARPVFERLLPPTRSVRARTAAIARDEAFASEPTWSLQSPLAEAIDDLL